MFIKGSNEWLGSEANTFLSVRTALEYKLLDLGFEFFYGGMVSKRAVYERHFPILGHHFDQVFVPFDFKNAPYILSPEYTFRVYEYLERKHLLNRENRVFYSQEMIRNEALEDIEEGKTFSFWQIGFEIFGKNEKKMSIEAITVAYKALAALPLKQMIFRITDKRIFKSLCKRYNIENGLEVSMLLDQCHEDGELFYQTYVSSGGNIDFAAALRHLLCLSADNKLTFSEAKKIIWDEEVNDAFKDLMEIEKAFEKVTGNPVIKLVPYMPKTWDAYTNFIFDVRVPKYDKAIAGGGNLWIDEKNPYALHSGVGIGVTRIVEYMLEHGLAITHEASVS